MGEMSFNRAYRLADDSLNKIRVFLAKSINCRIEDVKIQYDSSKGYYFYGPYNICVADLLMEGPQYRGVSIYGGVVSDLKVQLEEERKRSLEDARNRMKRNQIATKERERKEKQSKKTKFVLQKYVVPGVMITALGIGALTGVGAIRNHFVNEPTEVVQEQQQSHINTVANANDLILYSWANYAMGELSDIVDESQYDQTGYIADNIRVEYFIPIMSSYYNYIEEGMLDLPYELTGDSIKTNHNSFRNNAYLFDEALQNKGFGGCSFDNSPFADAIVIDAYGKIVSGAEDGLFGEVYDSNGDLITLESDMGYSVYVRAQDVKDNEYGTSNYPEDAIMYKGVAYVNSSHLNDFEAPSRSIK